VFITLLHNIQCFSQEAATAQYDDYYNYSDTTSKILPANTDDFKIELRILPNNVLNDYKNNSAFDYENILEDNEDWIAKISNWINQQLARLRYSDAYSTTLDLFYYGLIIFALTIIVWGLIKGDRRFLFFRNSVNNEIQIIEQKEDINQLDFDELIANAIENKHYKLAVRYMFLKSLRLLSNKDIIDLKKDKTNNQYLSEINNIQVANAFRDATLRFEWIWYGDFPIDENIMDSSKIAFNNLLGLIKS
jgi:hypothetical protein